MTFTVKLSAYLSENRTVFSMMTSKGKENNELMVMVIFNLNKYNMLQYLLQLILQLYNTFNTNNSSTAMKLYVVYELILKPSIKLVPFDLNNSFLR